MIFLTVIIISAFMRSILYQFDWFKDASGDGATEAVIHFQNTYEVEKIDDHFFIRNYSGSPLLSAIKRVIYYDSHDWCGGGVVVLKVHLFLLDKILAMGLLKLLGVGEETIFQLFDGHISDPALTNWPILIAIVVLKIILTGFTIIAGGSAGLLIPAIFTGALSANALFLILNSLHVLPDYSGLHHLFMVVGVASSLICVLDLPIATVIFVAEIFGVSYIAPAILSITIARVLMRKFRPYLGL